MYDAFIVFVTSFRSEEKGCFDPNVLTEFKVRPAASARTQKRDQTHVNVAALDTDEVKR